MSISPNRGSPRWCWSRWPPGLAWRVGGQPDPILLLHTLLGTALVAASASAANHLLERESDRLMPRTANRPLPAGRLSVREVFLFAAVTLLAGLLYLAVAANALAALLGGRDVGDLRRGLHATQVTQRLEHRRRGGRGGVARADGGPPPSKGAGCRHWPWQRCCSCGNFRTSWRSPGFIAISTPRPA